MCADNRYVNQKVFWEHAGSIGYDRAMFSSKAIASHILGKHWSEAIDIALAMGLDKDSRILELGCGDGTFSKNVLARHFLHIDAYDISRAAIERAESSDRPDNVSFFAQDAISMEFGGENAWDGVFMMGFLHHVKAFAPEIIRRVSGVAPVAIVMEPNGDNFIRKSVELLPSYRRAGEDSFTLRELRSIFGRAGYELAHIRRRILVPPFIPDVAFPIFKIIEKIAESNSLLSNFCASNIMGFRRTPSGGHDMEEER
jgi:SAM-dependent methyltransferase